MDGSFISVKDKIIASAIDIISESGLESLSTKTIAMKENMSETLLYKYYIDMNELLQDVVEYYCKFDKSIQKTITAKKGSNMDKLIQYIEAYATYYDNYYAISTLMLQYEELLHNVYTRDRIAECINDRFSYVEGIFKDAIDAGEIIDLYTPEELANQIIGYVMMSTLSRRIKYHDDTYKTELLKYTKKFISLLKK